MAKKRHPPTRFAGPIRRALVSAAGVALLGSGCHLLPPNSARVETPTLVRPAVDLGAPSPSTEAAVGDDPVIVQTATAQADPPRPPDPPAVPPPTDERVIDLGTAFRLAGIDNPTINFTRAAIDEAVAQRSQARVLLVPSLTAGGNLHLHSGPVQRSSGQILDVDSQSLYVGSGALAVGANPVAFPGVQLYSHLGDALYAPQITNQRVTVRTFDSRAIANQVLLRVTEAYLDLLQAEALVDLLRESETQVAEVVRLTAAYAKAGQGRVVDAHRAEADAQLLRQERQAAEGEVASAAARLAELLNLDPACRLRTPTGAVRTVPIVDDSRPTEELVRLALRDRPEMAARAAAISEANYRVRQEGRRPLFPTVLVGYSAGWFGGGSNLVASDWGRFTGRNDFDAFAVWTFQNAGLGNAALWRRAQAQVGERFAERQAVVNQVRDEVAAAQAEVRAIWRAAEVSRDQLPTAAEGFALDLKRIRSGEGLPIEVLDNFRLLVESRTQLLRAVVAYNRAQFRLFVALGCSPLLSADRSEPHVE